MDARRSTRLPSQPAKIPEAPGREEATSFAGSTLVRSPARPFCGTGVLAGGVLAAAMMLLPTGCDTSAEPTSVASDLGNPDLATLDVRGGVIRPNSQIQGADDFFGEAGNGGELRVLSATGDVDISSTPLTLTPEAPVLTGIGLDVLPGTTIEVVGLREVDFLRVQSGGTLLLTGNTLFVVSAGVDVSGIITSRKTMTITDGHSLTIDAGGTVNISGGVNLSGSDNVLNESSDFISGGDGGNLFIFARGSLTASPGPHLFISGLIKTNGGRSDGIFLANHRARPGTAGDISVGTVGDMAISGKLLARGGDSVPTEQVSFGDGGRIDVSALGDISIGGALEVNADGGVTTGLVAGDGGLVTIEAPLGLVSIDGVDVLLRGGDTEFSRTSFGGPGGELVIYGDSLSFNRTVVSTDGGGITRGTAQDGGDVEGFAADAGPMEIAGRVSMDFSSTAIFLAVGGDANLLETPGGSGGNVKVINIDENNLAVIDFQGRLFVRGGIDTFGTLGPEGEICVRGASGPTVDRLSALSGSPVTLCPLSTATNFLLGVNIAPHDLDCDPDTIIPGIVDVSSPAVLGVDFFRIRVDPATTDLTITISGAVGSNLDVFAADSSVLGSTLLSDYPFSGTGPTADEIITLDLTTFATGSFVSVMVLENNFFATDYIISVSCFP